MLNKNIGPSGIPQRHSAPKNINAIPVSGGKRRSRTLRLYKDHHDAYITRTISRDYKMNGANSKKGYVISMLWLDDVWYIQLTASLARLLGYKDGTDLRRANPDDVYTFKTVSYGENSCYSKPPPPTSNVHNTLFLKYDEYKEWLPKTKNGRAFLPFLTESFGILRIERNFVPHYTTAKPLVNYNDIEEIPDAEISTDLLAVLAPEIVSGESQGPTPFKIRLDKKLRSIQEKEQRIMTDGNTPLQEKVKDLCSQISELVKFRDGLAEAFLMDEESEKDKKAKYQYLEALMSLAAEDRAKSEE